MKIVYFTLVVITIAATGVAGQAKPKATVAKPVPAVTPTPAAKAIPSPAGTVEPGTLVGRTYANTMLGFDIVFPETWLVPDDDFKKRMQDQGYEKVKVPTSTDPQAQANIRRFEKHVTLLVTAYSSFPRKPKDAMLRITAEDISDNPKIKDAVDYFDLMRAQIGTMKLPSDFEYSLVDAEKLGSTQFGFLSTSSKEGKRRMYATVRGSYAIMFTLTYWSDMDLAVFRRMLESANFQLRTP